MKLYGNEDAETQYIAKAKRCNKMKYTFVILLIIIIRASNLFECDTLESSITLMMMALYLGGDRKAHNLILMAQNALKVIFFYLASSLSFFLSPFPSSSLLLLLSCSAPLPRLSLVSSCSLPPLLSSPLPPLFPPPSLSSLFSPHALHCFLSLFSHSPFLL